MNRNKSTSPTRTTPTFKQTLLLSALLSAFSANTVLAQETESATQEDDGVERIMVTASKRPTALQQTPIAVNVTSGEDIEQAKVLDLIDLQVLVPTLRIIPLQRSTNTDLEIRGFGSGPNNVGIEPSVGIFIDGVYRSRAASQIGDLPRLEQIEVLSGPQSTLFGKNSSAGVISVRTSAPTDYFTGKVEVGVANYNQRLLRGYVSNAISDELSFSLSGGMNTRDGYTKSIVGLDDVNTRDRWNLRGQLLYKPTDDVTFRLIADYSEIDEICCSLGGFENGPTAAAVEALGGVVTDDADPFSYESALNVNPNDTVEDGGISLQADVDFEGFAFTSITAFRSNDSTYINDVDFTSLDIIRETGGTFIDTFTQEFRLTSTGDNKLDWMVGGYYFNEDIETGDVLIYGESVRPYFDLLNSFDPASAGILGTLESLYPTLGEGDIFKEGTTIATDFTQQNEAYSLFVNLDYHLTENFTATLGVSYTYDEKEVTVQQLNDDLISAIDFDTAPTVFGVTLVDVFTSSFIDAGLEPAVAVATAAGTVESLKGFQFQPQILALPNAVEDNTSDDDKVTWSARGAYTLNENVNFFATAATGFKATSWNLSRFTRPFLSDAEAIAANSDLVLANQDYGTRFAGPEEATVYELGIKSNFDTVSFSATIFDQTIKGFQSSTFDGVAFVLANAGEQNTKGVEFDTVYRATDNLTLSLSGSLIDPVFVSFVGGQDENGPADLSGKSVRGVHEQSIVAGINYDLDFDNGMYGYLRTDYIYESDTRVGSTSPDFVRREVSTLNASAGLNFDNGWALQLYVRNLNNDEYFLAAFPRPIQAGSIQIYPNQPRTFGASVTYEFE